MLASSLWPVDLAICLCRPVQEGGQQKWEACSEGDPGATATSLNQLADAGHSSKVLVPPVTNGMMWAALQAAQATVAQPDLAVYERFTAELGQRG